MQQPIPWVMAKGVKQKLITCPACEGGTVEELLINKLGIHVFVCNECNSLWRHKKDLYLPDKQEDFTAFMEGHGILGLRDDVTLIDVAVLKAQK